MKKLDARHVHGRYGSEDEFDSCSEWDDDEAVDRAWDGVARSTARQTGTVTRSRDQLSATAADQHLRGARARHPRLPKHKR